METMNAEDRAPLRRVDPSAFSRRRGSGRQKLASDLDQQVIAFAKKWWWVGMAFVILMVPVILYRQELMTPLAYAMEGVRPQ